MCAVSVNRTEQRTAEQVGDVGYHVTWVKGQTQTHMIHVICFGSRTTGYPPSHCFLPFPPFFFLVEHEWMILRWKQRGAHNKARFRWSIWLERRKLRQIRHPEKQSGCRKITFFGGGKMWRRKVKTWTAGISTRSCSFWLQSYFSSVKPKSSITFRDSLLVLLPVNKQRHFKTNSISCYAVIMLPFPEFSLSSKWGLPKENCLFFLRVGVGDLDKFFYHDINVLFCTRLLVYSILTYWKLKLKKCCFFFFLCLYPVKCQTLTTLTWIRSKLVTDEAFSHSSTERGRCISLHPKFKQTPDNHEKFKSQS